MVYLYTKVQLNYHSDWSFLLQGALTLEFCDRVPGWGQLAEFFDDDGVGADLSPGPSPRDALLAAD